MTNKQVRMLLHVNPEGAERGQWCRPCVVEYTVNPIGSKSLYKVVKITDKHKGTEYDVTRTLELNCGDMDEMIAKSDPNQVKFAKKELGVDLKTGKKFKPAVQKPVETEEDDPFL